MTHQFYFRGIQAKTFYIFIFVFIIIILPVNVIIYGKVKELLTNADTHELKLEAEGLLARVRLDPLAIPLPPPGSALKVQWNREEIFEDLFSSPDFPDLEPYQYFLEECEADSFKVVTNRKSGMSSGDLLFSLARSNRRLQAQLIDLRFYLFAANASSIFVAGLVLFLATGITLRPIRKIIHVAERINASKSIERVPVPESLDENKLLAEALNDMIARIELTIQNQTNFFASAAHELKTPLSVMQAELSIALQKETNPEVVKILQSNLIETQRLERVIQDFLLISQLRSDSLILRKQKIELDEALYSATKKTKYLFQERRSTVKMMMEDKPFWIYADHDKLETVLTNLLENAIRYSPEDSVILVGVKKEGEHIILSVSNPIVKPVSNIGDLTNEYRKSEELSSGLGMGLWICKRILDMHKITFSLQQEGLTFRAALTFVNAHGLFSEPV